jgi:putative ABC transport system ATP-binding protein
MIKIEDLSVVFNKGTPLERAALRDVNFTVQDGEIVSIIGNAGSGRSALLQFLAGHVRSTSGKLWFDKTDVTSQTLAERSAIFSAVFYDHSLSVAGNLTVLENLAVASSHRRERSFIKPAISEKMREELIERLRAVDFMNMEDLADEKVCEIAKKYRQVLGLMIAVIKETQVLLIDEHCSGLDRESAVALLETTEKIIKSKKITTIMVANDLKFALEASDRVIALSHGEIALNLSGEEKRNAELENLFALLNAPLKKTKPYIKKASAKSRFNRPI